MSAVSMKRSYLMSAASDMLFLDRTIIAEVGGDALEFFRNSSRLID